MEITINLDETELSNVELQLIANSLDIPIGEIDLALQKICKTALMEYLKMFREKGVPTRADEVQQERLFFLLNYYYESRLPTESEVSNIFQLTQSQSKTLLRNTKSRYRNKISGFIKQTAKSAIDAAVQNGDGGYEFICTSPSTIEELNAIITQKGPELKPIEKIRGMASKFVCSEDSFDLLQIELS